MKSTIEKALADRLNSGRIDRETYDNLLGYFRHQNKNNLAKGAAKVYELRYGEDKNLSNYVSLAIEHGDWANEKDIKKASESLDKILEAASKKGNKDYFALAEDLNNPEHADLYATFILNIPEVRNQVKAEVGTYENLYRVTSGILRNRNGDDDEEEEKKKPKYRRERKESEKPTEDLEPNKLYLDILKLLPDDHFSDLKETPDKLSSQQKEEHEDKVRLYSVLKEKAKRDSFKLFKNDEPHEAISNLENFVNKQTNSNIHYLYEDQLEIFRGYIDFQEKLLNEEYINPDFENPATGEKNVLPSFHQLVAIYHNLEEKRFGIFDDCGTGKTAIAALLKPLIIDKREKEGKTVHGRTLVIGPKASSKAWNDGLEGELKKRYFSQKQKVAWINGKKDNEFLEELKESDFMFVNYEQLLTDFCLDGEKKKVYEVLMELGYDHLIIDEVQEAKNHQTSTKNGKITESLAVRILATDSKCEHLSLLSGTPMPDNLNDYANIFFMLKPDYFIEKTVIDGKQIKQLKFDDIKDRFKEIYEGDPRALYTFVRQNTIRRTSEEVSDLPGHKIIEDDIELTPVQEKIIKHIFKQGKPDWISQVRYALLDPRLVSPEILQEMDLIGKVTREDSAKYNRLEELLSASDGPLANNEKVVIFSSMYKNGVTRNAKNLKEEYARLGLSEEFKKLDIKDIKEELETNLQQKFKRQVKFTTIEGDTIYYEREQAVDQLNNGLDGIICTTKSGGVSMNFSAATTAIFLDQDYSPATTEQAIARIVRRGQKSETKIYFLYGKDSIDHDIKKLVENKQTNIQIALDGIDLLDKEKDIIWGNNTDRIKDLYLKRKGGLSIDLSDHLIDDINSFQTKLVRKKKGTSQPIIQQDIYEETVAQEIRKKIASDPNCWHDQEFVQKYFDHFKNLGPYLLARAKVTDIIRRSLNEQIEFPKLLLADAAGHGVLYSAFQELDELVGNNGFEMPLIVDRDFSQPMYDLSLNPHKYLADMCGQPGIFDQTFFEEFGKFDFIDNSSISLLPNKNRIRDYVLESNRILELGGHFQLGVRSLRFDENFFEGMKRSGFEPIVKSVRHNISNELFKFLKKQFGQHYAGAYQSKLNNTNFSLFQKVDEVHAVEDKYFRLMNPDHIEEEEVSKEPVKVEKTMSKGGNFYVYSKPMKGKKVWYVKGTIDQQDVIRALVEEHGVMAIPENILKENNLSRSRKR